MAIPVKSKEDWFESFRLEGVENVQRYYGENRYKKEKLPLVHKYAKEWLAKQLGRPPKSPWSRGDILTAIGILIGIAAFIAAAVVVPEFRAWIGLP